MINFETVLNAMDEGVLIVNEENKIVYFNHAYGDFIGHRLEEVKGVVLTDIRPGAKMPEALKNGNGNLTQLQKNILVSLSELIYDTLGRGINISSEFYFCVRKICHGS